MFSRYALSHRLTTDRQRYGFAAAATVAALGLRLAAHPILQARPAFALFTLPVVASAAFGGIGPAVFSAFLSVALVQFLVPDQAFDDVQFIEVLLFSITAFGVIWLGRVVEASRRNTQSALDEAHVKADALAEREAHLQSILETVPDAMIVIDPAGRIESFSITAERTFGYAAQEVIGQNVRMLMPGPYKAAHDGYLKRYMSTGERHIIGKGRIVVGLRKNGSSFPLELSVGEMRANGRVHFTGFIRDISERQNTEARLQELQVELLHMSRMTALGEMASALSHEINQPLSAISNYLRGARRLLQTSGAPTPDAVEDALQKAADQAIRAGEIIRRAREFVRTRESEKRIESLPRMIEEASALALVGAKEHGVNVTYDLGADAMWVLADRVQIQQVLLNLMRNAIDAMADSARKHLRIGTRVDEDGMVRISICDSGPGVAPELLERLFQPFVTTKARGMGVGLSISKSISEAHGGRLWTEPDIGGGANFMVTLPLAQIREAVHDA